MEGYVEGEFYLMYERMEDYADVMKGLGQLKIDGKPVIPDRILPYRHIPCIHVQFSEGRDGLEEVLASIEKVKEVERVPRVETKR